MAAFWTMYYSSLMYVFQIVVSVVYTYSALSSYVIAGVLLVAVGGSYMHTNTMVKHATVIFMPNDKVSEMIEAAIMQRMRAAQPRRGSVLEKRKRRASRVASMASMT